MPNLGVPELLILLVIVIAIFGAGRLGELGRAVGQSIRELRLSLREEGGHEA